MNPNIVRTGTQRVNSFDPETRLSQPTFLGALWALNSQSETRKALDLSHIGLNLNGLYSIFIYNFPKYFKIKSIQISRQHLYILVKKQSIGM